MHLHSRSNLEEMGRYKFDNLSLDMQQACKTIGMGVGTCILRTQEAETQEAPLGLLASQPSQICEP